MTIPKIIHRVVPEQVPPRFEAFWRRFAELHPDWELRTWQDPLDPGQFELGHKFAECTSGAQLAGLVRLEVLWRYGGVYVDMDIEPLRPFDPLRGVPAFIGTENGEVLTDALMAAERGHPGFRACMNRVAQTPMSAGALATGPLLVTAVLSGRDDVQVLPPRFFYPAKFDGLQEGRDRIIAEGRSFAIHHWHRSWNGARLLNLGEGRERLAKTADDLRRALRRTVKNRLVKARQGWDRLVAQRPEAHAHAHSEGRLLLVTDDGIALLVPSDPGMVSAEALLNGRVRPGLSAVIEQYVEPADVVVVTGDHLGYATIAAARRVGRHGTVVLHRPGEMAGENLRLHGYGDTGGRVVTVRDAAEFRSVTTTPRRSLRPTLVIGSSAPASLGFLHEVIDVVRSADALVIDVPSWSHPTPVRNLDDLLRAVACGRTVHVAGRTGELTPSSVDQVLVTRGFETVVMARKSERAAGS